MICFRHTWCGNAAWKRRWIRWTVVGLTWGVEVAALILFIAWLRFGWAIADLLA